MTQEIEQVCFDENVEPLDPSTVHQVPLATGRLMPVAAFGTFHSDWAQDYMEEATAEAIRLGWRHIDTARAYENEDVVGAAIRRSIREGWFIDRTQDWTKMLSWLRSVVNVASIPRNVVRLKKVPDTYPITFEQFDADGNKVV